jgi:hypothetical protein
MQEIPFSQWMLNLLPSKNLLKFLPQHNQVKAVGERERNSKSKKIKWQSLSPLS